MSLLISRANPNLDRHLQLLEFTEKEKRALVSFLRASTGDIRDGWRWGVSRIASCFRAEVGNPGRIWWDKLFRIAAG